LLFALIAVSIGATALVALLPRLLLGSRLPKQPGVIMSLWYFLCLGAGYIMIQVALIQKFVLLLGHPAYALTVIVFSMLVASGAGSYWSPRIVSGDDARLVRALRDRHPGGRARIRRLTPGFRRRCLALEPENGGHRAGHRAGGFHDGHTLPERAPAAGRAPSAVGALGLVAERGGERCSVQRVRSYWRSTPVSAPRFCWAVDYTCVLS